MSHRLVDAEIAKLREMTGSVDLVEYVDSLREMTPTEVLEQLETVSIACWQYGEEEPEDVDRAYFLAVLFDILPEIEYGPG